MAQIHRTAPVAFFAPLDGLVSRSLQVVVFLDPTYSPNVSVSGSFVVAGSTVGSFVLTLLSNTGAGAFYQWMGLVPNGIQAGQQFTVNVAAHDVVGTPQFQITTDGSASRTTQLEFVVPSLAV